MSKYNASKVSVDSILFDSKIESEFYIFLKRLKESGMIKDFKIHPKYLILEGFVSDIRKERPIIYEADFEIINNNLLKEVIDIKGLPTPEAKIKRKLFMHKYKMPLHWIVKSKKFSTCLWLDYFILSNFRKEEKKNE